MDDSRLVALFQQGDSQAFDEIDRRYRGKLCRFLAFRTNCSSDAEELTQRTLFQAFRGLVALKTGCSLASWLYQIARRVLLDDLRKNRPIPFSETTSSRSDSETIENKPSFADQIRLERLDDPLQIVARREASQNIWAIAENVLSEDEFQILWLRYAEEKSDQEIGERTGKNARNVRVVLHRARRKLFPALRQILDDFR